MSRCLEEGDDCPECMEKGGLQLPLTENCSCHIRPPCDACVSKPLTCTACGYEASGYEEV